jgi:hypothetical protein
MNLYLEGTIEADTFAQEYDICYNQNIDSSSLTPLEEKLFYGLMEVACRFSPHEEDIINCPGVYFTETDLHKKVIEVQEIFDLNSPING